MEPGLKLTKEDDSSEVDATEYRKVIGCLRYLTHTRPDLAYSVGYVSRYMQSPRASHYQAVKYILRYIKGTTDLGIHYKKGGSNMLLGFSDSSFAVDLDDGKGTTGVVFYFNDGPVAWISQKQSTVALSSCEAELMAANSAACQGVWLRGLLAEMTGRKEEPVMIKVDSQSATALIKNPGFRSTVATQPSISRPLVASTGSRGQLSSSMVGWGAEFVKVLLGTHSTKTEPS
ncbi:hypothetical protein E3N88_44886 [Mikania micrantha]|uniref:Reverse transcriptase Ty1/copia-type domain-containing protein n=1 Tax=Mikania micrantha TaxID=192012 RepID=A0A5N6LAS8_9ASTR|nr:hypothetical protein E3N88_44886 [Mikania micrantha]